MLKMKISDLRCDDVVILMELCWKQINLYHDDFHVRNCWNQVEKD